VGRWVPSDAAKDLFASIQTQQKLAEMRRNVELELQHIPRGGVEQNLFRQYYQTARMNSLGGKAKFPDSKKIVLSACLDYLKKLYPDFEPKYDENFFREKKKIFQQP